MSLTEMQIQDPWWSLIFNGKKTIEGRKRSSTWAHIRIGDTLRCIEPTRKEYFDVIITDIRNYGGNNPLF